MIRIADPSNLGTALRDIRHLLGYNRREIARTIAEATGRHEGGIYRQIQEWDVGHHSPTARALGPILDALDYDLALVPKLQPGETELARRAPGDTAAWFRQTGTGWPDAGALTPDRRTA